MAPYSVLPARCSAQEPQRALFRLYLILHPISRLYGIGFLLVCFVWIFLGKVPRMYLWWSLCTRIPGESYRRRFRFLLLYLCYVFRALINSFVCSFGTQQFLKHPILHKHLWLNLQKKKKKKPTNKHSLHPVCLTGRYLSDNIRSYASNDAGTSVSQVNRPLILTQW